LKHALVMGKKPIRGSSDRKKSKSEREFEDLIDPYFIHGWNKNDYGIDTIVEITTNNSNIEDDIELESKCFLVQLKSTKTISASNGNISFRVLTNKIHYWYKFNLPVALILYGIEEKKFYYIWIDDLLITQLEHSNPNWSKQKSITLIIPITNTLTKSTVIKLKDYVHVWKILARRTLKPGKYFELRRQGFDFLNEFKNLIQPFAFSSITETIKSLEVEIDQSIYRIAITGPSRVGKSSLINALLKKTVSPVGFWQTTGVPIQIIPDSEESVIVYFKDGKSLKGRLSIDFIAQYASQSKGLNEDNIKQVRLISISIKNQNLERGVSIFDIPGLDDASDEVLEYTWQTIQKVNAIIYVIDASPAQNGGFIFRNEFKKHLIQFTQSQDKVFLVFNKTDFLSKNILAELKEKVRNDLIKYNLIERLNNKIFYVSAPNNTPDIDNVEQLNDCIWDFILNENKFGIAKLSFLNQELFQCTKSLIEILKVRLIDNEKRKLLETSISAVKNKIPILDKAYKEKLYGCADVLSKSISLRTNSIMANFEKWLKNIPLNQELPNNKQIKKYLNDSFNQSIEHTNKEYEAKINNIKIFIDQWIEENLKQVREILSENPPNKRVDFSPEIESIQYPEISISSAWGMGIVGLAAGFLFNPWVGLFGGLTAFFANLIASAESRRLKKIDKIIETVKDKSHLATKKINVAFLEVIREHSTIISKYVNSKLNFYFADLQKQLSFLDSPLSNSEREAYQHVFNEIDGLQNRIRDFEAELKSFFYN